MIPRFLSLICVFYLITIFNITLAEPTLNYDQEKKILIAYAQSGEYQQEITDRLKPAFSFLDSVQNQYPSRKLAIVLDIDETALSNVTELFALYDLPDNIGDSFPDSMLQKATRTFHATAIEPVLALYRYALAHHFTIFFISGRWEHDRLGTESNLKQVGYITFAQLFLRRENNLESAISFKSTLRQQIEAQGYLIVLNIGDQQSDLTGGYAIKTIKLPNPFYEVL